ncbi:hypothetical protein [Cellulosimicrobium cellulans]|uniref:hypothetical protein n=1 Tax=Cellulosimicrobium cellulans TaxID=1710 RepID=UPI003C535296
MATNDLGLIYPTGSDEFAPHLDMESLADSFAGRLIVPVPNIAARDALAAAMSPSTTEPLIVRRADAAVAVAVEITTNGTDWTPLAAQQSALVTTFGTGWTPTAGTEHQPRVTRLGNRVFITGAVTRSTGSTGDILTVPAAFQPPSTGTRFIGAVFASNATAGMLALSNGRVSVPTGYGTLTGVGTFALPVVGNWTMD